MFLKLRRKFQHLQSQRKFFTRTRWFIFWFLFIREKKKSICKYAVLAGKVRGLGGGARGEAGKAVAGGNRGAFCAIVDRGADGRVVLAVGCVVNPAPLGPWIPVRGSHVYHPIKIEKAQACAISSRPPWSGPRKRALEAQDHYTSEKQSNLIFHHYNYRLAECGVFIQWNAVCCTFMEWIRH